MSMVNLIIILILLLLLLLIIIIIIIIIIIVFIIKEDRQELSNYICGNSRGWMGERKGRWES